MQSFGGQTKSIMVFLKLAYSLFSQSHNAIRFAGLFASKQYRSFALGTACSCFNELDIHSLNAATSQTDKLYYELGENSHS